MIAAVIAIREHFIEAGHAGENQLSPALAARLGPSGSGLYDAANRLHRCETGQRDWDINLDGMAHYGLLPDLMQDLRNVGLDGRVMDTLYRSAGHYVALWERCRQLAPTSRLQPVSARPTGLALVTAIDGHYLVACGTRGGVRTIHRNGAGRWQDHQLTAAPTALLSGLEANPGGPGYPVVSVIDPQGRGWFNRLSATTPWLFLDPNGLPPLAAMVALEGASQTDLYAMTGDGTLSVSVLRHGPGVSIAPDPWMPLDGLAPVGPGASLYGFGDGSGQYHLVLITAAGSFW